MDQLKIEYHSLLKSDEKVIWHGKPIQGVRFKTYGCLTIPGLFVFFLIFLDNWKELIFPVIMVLGLRYILLSIYIIMGSKYRGKKYYVMTNQRIIVIDKLILKFAKSYNINEYEFQLCSVKNNGIGTIRFNKSKVTNMLFCIVDRYLINPQQSSLRMISEASKVYETICSIKVTE